MWTYQARRSDIRDLKKISCIFISVNEYYTKANVVNWYLIVLSLQKTLFFSRITNCIELQCVWPYGEQVLASELCSFDE